MDHRDCLAHYPFVVVRIRCRVCARKGSYRLARIAAKYGPEITLRDLLDRFSYDCLWRTQSRTKRGRTDCGVYLPDLEHKRPPDLPPGMVKLRLVKGGWPPLRTLQNVQPLQHNKRTSRDPRLVPCGSRSDGQSAAIPWDLSRPNGSDRSQWSRRRARACHGALGHARAAAVWRRANHQHSQCGQPALARLARQAKPL